MNNNKKNEIRIEHGIRLLPHEKYEDMFINKDVGKYMASKTDFSQPR